MLAIWLCGLVCASAAALEAAVGPQYPAPAWDLQTRPLAELPGWLGGPWVYDLQHQRRFVISTAGMPGHRVYYSLDGECLGQWEAVRVRHSALVWNDGEIYETRIRVEDLIPYGGAPLMLCHAQRGMLQGVSLSVGGEL